MRPLLALVFELLEERTIRACSDPMVLQFACWLGSAPRSQASRPVHAGIWRYQEVAVSALTSALEIDSATFAEGFQWLKERTFFSPNAIRGLEADPLALLAIAIGVRCSMASDTEARGWVERFAMQSVLAETDPSRLSLLGAARALVSFGGDWTGVAPELVVALEAKGVATSSAQQRDQALQRILAQPNGGTYEAAVVGLAALRCLVAFEAGIDLHRASVFDVANILRRVPDALKRWPWERSPRTKREGSTAQKWDTQNEYHVQALLFALLRPVFPDLQDEEYLKTLGYKHPRVDLAIPSLRVIVEVKYLYRSQQADLAAVQEQVSADTGLYLSHDNGFDRIVAFIWDATGSVQHHSTIVGGLRRLKGIQDAVIVSRPGSWT